MESKIIDAGGWYVKVWFDYSYDKGDYDIAPAWSLDIYEYVDPVTDQPMEIHDDDINYIETQLLKEIHEDSL